MGVILSHDKIEGENDGKKQCDNEKKKCIDEKRFGGQLFVRKRQKNFCKQFFSRIIFRKRRRKIRRGP